MCIRDSYDSASADTKVALKVGENHDYTLYLQPNLYTVEEGHTLALVIYTYEQGKARYTQNYQITLDNASVKASIPVDEIPSVDPVVNPFTDVAEGSYCYDAVLWAISRDPQITNGYTEDTFVPGKVCNRAQAVTFLYRAAGCPDVSGVEVSFTDVEEGAYYYDAMLWAVKNGITKGTTATTFSPFEPVTRAQVVTFLYRAENTPDVSDVEVSFTDVNEGAFYYDAMLWAVKNGITNGTTETTFSPNDGCSRGQIVTFLYRCLAEA